MSNVQSGTEVRIGKQNEKIGLGWVKFAASVVASLTLILILLGFGVSLAVESKLLLPHSSLFESSAELLDLGSVAVFEMLPKLVDNLGKIGTYFEVISSVMPLFCWATAVYAFVVAVVFFFRYHRKIDVSAYQEKIKASLAGNEKKSFLVRAGLPLLFFPALFLSPIFLYFFLACAMVVLAFVPMVGWFSGMAYIDEVAIKERVCTPLPSILHYQIQKSEKVAEKAADSKKQPATVQCVKILKDGVEIASGRLVLSTPKAMVLYLPNGIARRVPIGNSVIEVIDRLPSQDTQDTPSRQKNGSVSTDK